MRIALAIAVTVVVVLVALAIVLAGRASRSAGEQASAPTPVPTDAALPTTLHRSYVLTREEHLIQMADVLAHGVVRDISRSCFDIPDCRYTGAEDVPLDEIRASSHFPWRMYTVTFQVSETLLGELDAPSPLTLYFDGDSPVDPPPTRLPYEVVEANPRVMDWQLGQALVLAVYEASWHDHAAGLTRTVHSAVPGWSYYVAEDGSLSSPVSEHITRSATLADLRRHIRAYRPEEGGADPLPATLSPPTPERPSPSPPGDGTPATQVPLGYAKPRPSAIWTVAPASGGSAATHVPTAPPAEPAATSTPVFTMEDGPEAVAAALLDQWAELGWSTGPADLQRAVDVTASDATCFSTSPEIIASGSPVDVAAAISGTFQPGLPGSDGPYDWAVVLIERDIGAAYGIFSSPDPEQAFDWIECSGRQ